MPILHQLPRCASAPLWSPKDQQARCETQPPRDSSSIWAQLFCVECTVALRRLLWAATKRGRQHHARINCLAGTTATLKADFEFFFCLVCRASFRRFAADMNEPCVVASKSPRIATNVGLELLEWDVAQCGAWLCQLRNCRWKNIALQGFRQMRDICQRVRISWAFRTASKSNRLWNHAIICIQLYTY